MNEPSEAPGLFQGIYSYTEAARLIGVPVQRVARWADGYSFRVAAGRNRSAPVLQTNRLKYRGVLSYRELFELFYVREYVALKVSLQHIRDTAEKLAEVLGPYPFTHADLIVSGRKLLIQTAETVLKRPDVGQLVADFGEEFKKRVAFRDEVIAQYRPPGYADKILLDRQIRAGEPVVTKYGIPTRSVYALWQQEQMLEKVAEYFEVDQADVSVAIRYESEWRLAA